jgi:hypothetical protein
VEEKRLSIGKAAELLGVSIDTLRRWDKSSAFPAIKSPSGHRYYSSTEIELRRNDLSSLASKWVTADEPALLESDFYCENQSVFQSRLIKMEKLLANFSGDLPWFSLIVAAAGEIGNNSFDHNIGNWPNVPGIFYGYDLRRKEIVLGDRGRGVLATLRQVRPGLSSDRDALRTAFTEVISGRAPEARGNGLKYVRSITEQYPLRLEFDSGNAKAILGLGKLEIEEADIPIQGCLAKLTYT